MLRPVPFGALLAHSVHLAARVLVVGVALAVVMFEARSALAQTPPPPPTNFPAPLVAWVHPTLGVDPTAIPEALTYIDDPDAKFRTLQWAIDAVQLALAASYDAQSNPLQEGIVYALPGLYGQHGAESSGDLFPILMRDRVHVQGVGARRCVIRGTGVPIVQPGLYNDVTWPTVGGTTNATIEVLVTFETACPDTPLARSPGGTMLPWLVSPWYTTYNVAEILDGFTLQGGDIQVLFRARPLQPLMESSGRVSNCVLDLRHNWTPTLDGPSTPVAGPFIGVMLAKRSSTQGSPGLTVGYLDTPAFIVHNDFVFAEWGGNVPVHEGWLSESRAEAVGIADVSYAAPVGPNYDCDSRVRGLANPCIVANLFRTRPVTGNPPARPYAMIGVTDDDTRVSDGTGYVQTNAFDPARVGTSNGWFYSFPVQSMIVETAASNGQATLWNCQAYTVASCTATTPCGVASPPTNPAVSIWNGTSGLDPAFVGEYLAVTFGSSITQKDYRDWRLLPGSPLEDMGLEPPAGTRAFQALNGLVFPTSSDGLLDLYYKGWDGEHWGNSRVVGTRPDIGFDERHMLICAGSWANDSSSHNASGFMTPNYAQAGTQRYFILPDFTGGEDLTAVTSQLTIYQKMETPTSPQPGPGWINPPQSFAQPPGAGGLPADYRKKYIAWDNTGPLGYPGAWTRSLAQYPGTYSPLIGSGLPQSPLNFRLINDIVDDECASGTCLHSYFNMQGVVFDSNDPVGTVRLRGNMQGEYR